MNFDQLTRMLYQENINWVYSIIRELDSKGIEKKEKFIADPYMFNNIVALGYYFMNLYIVSNINNYVEDDAVLIMNSIITGASSYNQYKLSQIYKRDIELARIVDAYNTIVRVTKQHASNDGLKARVVAVDEVYRRIYEAFNKRHFNVFVKVFLTSFKDFEFSIKTVVDGYLQQR